MNINDLDPWSLPRLGMGNLNELQDLPGLYFVFKHSELLYIGKTETGFKSRWLTNKGHHRLVQFLLIGGVEVACQHIESKGYDLRLLEDEAIARFSPLLNGTRVIHDLDKIRFKRGANTQMSLDFSSPSSETPSLSSERRIDLFEAEARLEQQLMIHRVLSDDTSYRIYKSLLDPDQDVDATLLDEILKACNPAQSWLEYCEECESLGLL